MERKYSHNEIESKRRGHFVEENKEIFKREKQLNQ
jgi:hypothetical protein